MRKVRLILEVGLDNAGLILPVVSRNEVVGGIFPLAAAGYLPRCPSKVELAANYAHNP